jgi:hypothetical protein
VNCPLPSPADRLLFVLVYLKHNPLQILHARWFGLRQPKAHQWIYVLLPVLQATLESLGVAPSRALAALGVRLGLALETHAESGEASPPLFAMMAPSGRFRAPKLRQHRRRAIAARKSATP